MKRLKVTATKSEARGEDFDSPFHELSHDLRTPLNHITGFAELLLMDQSLGLANREYVHAILSGGATLKASVISYLDRIDRNALDAVALPTPPDAAWLQTVALGANSLSGVTTDNLPAGLESPS